MLGIYVTEHLECNIGVTVFKYSQNLNCNQDTIVEISGLHEGFAIDVFQK